MAEDRRQRPRILVVDDEDNARLLAQLSLERIDAEVTLARDGDEALALAAEVLPDLVLLDVVMPGLDGFEVCRRLRTAEATALTPIVLMTALDDVEAVDHAYEIGATDFVTKPVNWASLQHRALFILRAANALMDLAASAASLEAAQRIAGLGSWSWDAAAGDIDGSAVFWDLLRRDSRAMTGGEYVATIHESDRLQVETTRLRALRDGQPYSVEYRYNAPGGDARHLLEQAEPARDRRGEIIGLVGTVHDQTDRRRLDQQIHYMEFFDARTGLPNRAALVKELASAAGVTRGGREGWLIHLEVDRLDEVSTVLGRDAADEVVATISGRLREYLDGSPYSRAMLARIGTTRLAVLAAGVETDITGPDLARHLLAAAAERHSDGGREFVFEARAGVVRFPNAGADGSTLLAHAQLAAHKARPGRALEFSPELEQGSRARFTIEDRLLGAIERDEFELHYQPIVEAQSSAIHSFEALIRWHCPELGNVSPAQFIPIAEQSGAIDEITSWTLQRACRDAMGWSGLGHRAPIVAVNLSATQVAASGSVISKVADVLDETGLTPGLLELELTETALVEALGDSTPVLRGLRELGVRLSLDDFGTGFSSLSYLARFPMTTLKIDRAFISEVPGRPRSESIVRAIIAMSHQLGLQVVSEGVETREQLDFVRESGGDLCQGFLFSAAIRADEVTALLRDRRALLAPPPRRLAS